MLCSGSCFVPGVDMAPSILDVPALPDETAGKDEWLRDVIKKKQREGRVYLYYSVRACVYICVGVP